jgi:uncharacterized phage protein (TIGR02220 family)
MNTETRQQVIDYLRQCLDDIGLTLMMFGHQKNIDDLIQKGYSFEDFKAVIDYKILKWKDTDYKRYLRPETLFGNKFEIYLNESRKHTTFIQRLSNSVNSAKQLIDRSVVGFKRRS